MKAIMMSIKPQHVANILNGLKTIEIRKKFPKDYVGWVYIYCTSHKNHRESLYELETYKKKRKFDVDYYIPSELGFVLNSKVVARFWCDKVEEIKIDIRESVYFGTHLLGEPVLLKESCLSYNELNDYLKGKNGYAIHITKLEIFDEPKEIKEFIRIVKNGWDLGATTKGDMGVRLTSAPRSGWCYVEV